MEFSPKESSSMKFSPMEEIRFYTDVKERSSTYNYHLELAEEIQEDLLAKALEKTVRYFPKCQIRPVIAADGKGVIAKPNPLPIPIFHDLSPRALGTDEVNGYLFRIAVIGKSLYGFFFHAMGDGRATIPMMVQLVYEYMKLRGYQVDGEGMVFEEGDEGDPELLKLPDEYMVEKGIEPGALKTQTIDKSKVFSIREEQEYFDKDGFRTLCFWLDAKDFIDVAHTYHTTPLALCVVLSSRAMRKIYEVPEDAVIRSGFAVEYRGHFQSRSQREFYTFCDVYFSPAYLNASLEEACAYVREEIKRETALEVFSAKLSLTEKVVSMVHEKVDLRSPSKEGGIGSGKGSDVSNVFFSNLGMFKVPSAMKDFVTYFDTHFIPSSRDKNIAMVTYKDRCIFICESNGMDSRLERGLFEELRNLGIRGEILEEKVEYLDYLGNLDVDDPS